MSSYVPAAMRRRIAERADHLCEYCLIHEDDTFLGCQVEHVISEKHGGETTDANLAYACVFCNRFKGIDIATLSPRTGNLCRLFNPRTDLWAEHFRLEENSVLGITEIGDATVRLLGLNDSDRLVEREALIEAGRYPCPAAIRKLGQQG
jgi:hypothetical protein